MCMTVQRRLKNLFVSTPNIWYANNCIEILFIETPMQWERIALQVESDFLAEGAKEDARFPASFIHIFLYFDMLAGGVK